jgi:hypothetical protein
METKVYAVKADHPILARVDRIVSALEIEQFKFELKEAGYENVEVTECNTMLEARKALGNLREREEE